MATPPGARNSAGVTSSRRRSTGTAAQVAAYASSRVRVLIATADRKDPESVSTSIAVPVSRIATCGVWCRGWVRENSRGSSPSPAMANSSRGAASTSPLSVPAMDTSAPTTTTLAPRVPANAPAASASGRLEPASPGRVPMLTTCTRT